MAATRLILDHRNLELDAGGRLALRHARHIAHRPDILVAVVAHGLRVALDPALVGPAVGPWQGPICTTNSGRALGRDDMEGSRTSSSWANPSASVKVAIFAAASTLRSVRP